MEILLRTHGEYNAKYMNMQIPGRHEKTTTASSTWQEKTNATSSNRAPNILTTITGGILPRDANGKFISKYNSGKISEPPGYISGYIPGTKTLLSISPSSFGDNKDRQANIIKSITENISAAKSSTKNISITTSTNKNIPLNKSSSNNHVQVKPPAESNKTSTTKLNESLGSGPLGHPAVVKPTQVGPNIRDQQTKQINHPVTSNDNLSAPPLDLDPLEDPFLLSEEPSKSGNIEAEKSVPEGRGEVLQEDPFTMADTSSLDISGDMLVDSNDMLVDSNDMLVDSNDMLVDSSPGLVIKSVEEILREGKTSFQGLEEKKRRLDDLDQEEKEEEENIKKKQRVLEQRLLGKDCESLEKMIGNEDIIDAEAEFEVSISEDVTLSEEASLTIKM